jgi:two-component system, LuxR family, response regulator FixJ
MVAGRIIFIVDHDAEVRRAVELVMGKAGLRSRAYATVDEFLNDPELDESGCLILDPQMPALDSKRLVETLRLRNIHVPVIIISPNLELSAVAESADLGPVDFLMKPVDGDSLLPKVHEALRRDDARRAKEIEISEIQRRKSMLSERERQVLRLLVQGKLHKEIGRELNISTRTVDHHHAQINAKMHVSNFAELMHMDCVAGLR